MPIKQITAPAAAPFDVAEARLHVRQDITDDDAKLASLARAVAQFAETETWRAVVASRWEQSLDSFPGPSLVGVPYGRTYSLPGHAILLERSPLIQVVSIQYMDMAGAWQTMAPEDYVVDDSGPVPRITPIFGKIWPINRPQIGSVKVTFDAGYAAPLTADATANTITVRGWKTLAVDDVLRLTNSGGALPAPLQPDTDYYVVAVPAAGTYQLAATKGGSAIDIADAGGGKHYLGAVPDGLKAWMFVRLDSLYVHRGEAAIVQGKLEPLPYIDRLLDPFKVTM
ncbi:MAG: head-tail connector protein [Ignavibacteria bacterium]